MMFGDTKINERIYALIRKTPLVGPIFRIVNAYAYKGDVACNNEIAPFTAWWSRVFKKAMYVLLFIELIIIFNGNNVSKIKWEPADAIISVFPSVLGFGMGVFALLFIMPESFLGFLIRNRKSLSIGPEIVPVDIGYPLVVFTFSLAWAAFNKIFANDFTFCISMFVFFYGLAMAFELISFLFNSSLLIQNISMKEYNQSQFLKLKNKIKRK